MWKTYTIIKNYGILFIYWRSKIKVQVKNKNRNFIKIEHMRYFLSFLLFGVFSFNSMAQQSYCGATLSTAQKQWLKQFQQSQKKLRKPPGDKYLPMQVHIVGKDDGSGYYQLENLWSQVCDLNAAYSTTGLQFYLKFPLSYVDDTDMYEHTDFKRGL